MSRDLSLTCAAAALTATLALTPPTMVAAPLEVRNLHFASGIVREPDAARGWVVLRAFERGGHTFYLAVDPTTLTMRTIAAVDAVVDERPWATVREAIANTPYARALAGAKDHEAPLQDAGLTHVVTDRPGIDLTVDLCPSQRPMDRTLFQALVGALGGEGKPVPVGIAVTGVWLDAHPQDLAWLESLDHTGALSITWINHSFHHRVSKTLPLRSNFLLEPGTDLNAEVLEMERALLTRGLAPSVFFRFPGLVSTPAVFERILNLGLVPVGSDAWLGKNQWPTDGSIVLVHANGNEPLGVKRFIELLGKQRSEIQDKHWQLFDLRELVASRPQ